MSHNNVPLPQRLLEMSIVVGADNKTGLVVKRNQEGSKFIVDLFSDCYKSHLLHAASLSTVVSPFEEIKTDRVNTEETPRNSSEKNYNKRLHGEIKLPDKYTDFDHEINEASTLNEFCGKDFQELPFPKDVLNSLPMFCFPDDISLQKCNTTARFHYLILTDMAGCRFYGICCTFHRPAVVERNTKTTWQINYIEEEEIYLNPGQLKVYAPMCIAFISRYPYYNLLKDVLSKLVYDIVDNSSEIISFIKKVTLQLCMTPIPPPGELSFKFDLLNSNFIVHSHKNSYSELIDLPLFEILKMFQPSDILKLIVCVLTEQKIVFVSSSYCKLTVLVQILLYIIEPFEWQMTCIPTLPSELIEILEAPQAFLIGLNTAHISAINLADEIVIADIDRQEVTTSSIELPQVPQEQAYIFMAALRQIELQMNNSSMEVITPFNYEDSKSIMMERTVKLNHDIKHVCLQFMVNLFRDVLQEIEVDGCLFHRVGFLEKLPNEYQGFYEQVLNTQHFYKFLKDRFSSKIDNWAILEKEGRTNLFNTLTEEKKLSNSSFSRRRRSSVRACVLTKPPEYNANTKIRIRKPIYLPTFDYAHYENYYVEILSCIYECIETSESTNDHGQFYFLIGLLQLAQGEFTEAFSYFDRVLKHDEQIFPTNMINSLLCKLTSSQRNEIMNSELFIKSDWWMNLLNQSHKEKTADIRIYMDAHKLPKHDMNFKQFSTIVHTLEISTEIEAIKHLFDHLSYETTEKVTFVKFYNFYENWKLVDNEMNRLNSTNMKIESHEFILKMSSIIKTQFGTGRLILTQKRLLLMHAASENIIEIVKLKEVCDIKLETNTSFFKTNTTVDIIHENKKDLIKLTLDEMSELWLMILRELWTANLCADYFKDLNMIQLAAQNILILEVLYQSQPKYSNTDDTILSFHKICYFTELYTKEVSRLSMDVRNITKDSLQYSVKPNHFEFETISIESLIYIPGLHDLDEDYYINPQLWCGMNNGHVQVFDASMWTHYSLFTKAKDKISCLLKVGHDQVWASSSDTNIYIFSRFSKFDTEVLDNHSFNVTYLVLSRSNDVVYSSDIQGTINIWSVDTLTPIKTVKLILMHGLKNIIIYDDILFCLTPNRIILCDNELNLIKQTEINTNNIKELNCFLLVKDTSELWVGNKSKGTIVIYDQASLCRKRVIKLKCPGISSMISVFDRVWIGTSSGVIYVIHTVTMEIEKQLNAHRDDIRAMCSAQDRYVITGSGNKEGKILTWRTNA